MGSWCSLSIDGFTVHGSKSYVDDVVLSLFHERDRRVTPDPDPDTDPDPDCEDEPQFTYEYAVAARAMADRLDVLGFTIGRARADYGLGHAEAIADFDEDHWLSAADQQIERDHTYDVWRSVMARLAPQGFQTWEAEAWKHDTHAVRVQQMDDHLLGGHFSDLRYLLRGLLDALPDAVEVVLDYTSLATGGYYEEDEPICARARMKWVEDHPAYGPIVVLTEGRSDARILAAAIELISPHLIDLFGFLDFEGLRIQGSVDALARTVRAFVGARVSTRMLAVFDNDTAGHLGLNGLSDVSLPPNIRTIALPPCALARDYPTLGPQGLTRMDVNGLACGI